MFFMDTRTDNEKKRDKYKKIADLLEDLVIEMNRYFGEGADNEISIPILAKYKKLADESGDLSKGNMIFDFQAKVTENMEQFIACLEKMETARAELKQRFYVAMEWYCCYDRMVRADKKE